MAKAPTKNNAASAAPKGGTPSLNAENTPRHKLMAMGHKIETGAGAGSKTPA